MLNEPLYHSIQKALQRGPAVGLGGGKVIVTNPNKSMSGHYTKSPTGRTVFKIGDWGESYKVCCPWCGDRRHRLFISHRWGVYDPETRSRNFGMVKCFNESCQEQPGFLEDLKSRIDPDLEIFRTRSNVTVPIQLSSTFDVDTPRPVQGPGLTVSLSSLPEGHKAKTFLTKRGHDWKKLEKNFKVVWCESSPMAEANQRLVVPVYENGELLAWQARHINLDGSGDCSNLYRCTNNLCGYQWYSEIKPLICPECHMPDPPPRKVMKWFTAPKAKASHLMFNYQNALAWTRLVIVVEGPMDVFRVGNPKSADEPGPVVATFGHTISSYQAERLLMPWVESDGYVFLMYDSDVMDKTISQAIKLDGGPLRGRVLPIELPEGKDPGDLSHAELWGIIRQNIKECGLKLEV